VPVKPAWTALFAGPLGLHHNSLCLIKHDIYTVAEKFNTCQVVDIPRIAPKVDEKRPQHVQMGYNQDGFAPVSNGDLSEKSHESTKDLFIALDIREGFKPPLLLF
jgi:hypothetical protein